MSIEAYKDIVESIKILPYIAEFPRLANGGHQSNRVLTCREDARMEDVSGFDIERSELAIFVPGYSIHLRSDGTWYANPDGDN